MENREVDNSAWDGNRALSQCSTAADYRSICAGERAVGAPDERQHWALPHHFLGRGPNAAGVRNSLSRLPQTQGLTNEAAARRHLEAHMREINPERSERFTDLEPTRGIERDVTSPLARAAATEDGNTLVGYAAVFDTWTDISSPNVPGGHFRERIRRGAFTKTVAESADRFKVQLDHGRNPRFGSLPLGKPRTIFEDSYGLWTETALSNSRDVQEEIRPRLVEGSLDGMSFQFDVLGQEWNLDTSDGVPERDVTEVRLFEYGPVVWPAYETTTAGVRSRGVYGEPDPVVAIADMVSNFTNATATPWVGPQTLTVVTSSTNEEAASRDEPPAASPDQADAPEPDRRSTSAAERQRARLVMARADLERQREELKRWLPR